MTVSFRNLDFDTTLPMDQWPAEAIETVIDRGLTLRQFAQAAGTSAPRLSAYEKAKVAPTTDVLGRLAHVAEMSTTRPQVKPVG